MQQQASELTSNCQQNLINKPIITSRVPKSVPLDYMTATTTTTTNIQSVARPILSSAYNYESDLDASYNNNNDLSAWPQHQEQQQQYLDGDINDRNLNNLYYNDATHLTANQYDNLYPPSNYLTAQQQDLQREQEHEQQPQQHAHSTTAPTTISFDLDNIFAVINGEEFNYNDQQHQTRHQTQPRVKQEQIYHELNDNYRPVAQGQQHETEASIYEVLKTNIIDINSNDSSAQGISTPSPNSLHYTDMSAPSDHQRHLATNTAAANETNDLFKRTLNQTCATTSTTPTNNTTKPSVEIIEQPTKCALRFRYKCEGRSAGSLPGVNSTSDNKTYPTIRINNYSGRAVVVISCVTKDAPYRTHPHNIVGKEGCKKGVCTIVLDGSSSTTGDDDDETGDKATSNGGGTTSPSSDKKAHQSAPTSSQSSNCIIRTFSSLGIQCVKRKDIEDSLGLRESINVDPFRNGFSHKLDASAIDLNVVRLCFQVFIEGASRKCDIPLTPVVSDPIHDKKAMSDLVITKLSHCSAPVTGGREVILLCDRISKDDIQIRFFEESRDGKLIWETISNVSAADVHKQVAICFRTPKYYNEEITQPVMARIQLRRISDQQVSEPRLFQFLPCESDEDIISRKRKKVEWCNMNQYALDNVLLAAPLHHQGQHQQTMQQQLQEQQQQQQQQQQQYQQHMQSSPQHRQHQQQQQHMSMMARQQQQQQ